jgi:hypothetical protein
MAATPPEVPAQRARRQTLLTPITTKLVVVLGHSSCGAVTAAVESYLAPKKYAEIAFTHALRSLVDRIQTAVRGAASALERIGGNRVSRRTDYRAALLERAVNLNAAITAYDVQRELKLPLGSDTRVVYGVFDRAGQCVRSHPTKELPIFAEVPTGPDDFSKIAIQIARSALARPTARRNARRAREATQGQGMHYEVRTAEALVATPARASPCLLSAALDADRMIFTTPRDDSAHARIARCSMTLGSVVSWRS